MLFKDPQERFVLQFFELRRRDVKLFVGPQVACMTSVAAHGILVFVAISLCRRSSSDFMLNALK